MGTGRTPAERDAATVEIVYAATTGVLLAAAGFAAAASPALAGAAHGTARKAWLTAAIVLATALFCGRVAVTLRRFERLSRLRGTPHGAAAEGRRDGHAPPDRPGAHDPYDRRDDGRGPAGPRDRHGPAGPYAVAGAPVRVPRQRRGAGGAGGEGGPPPDQPSQPGRTSPDS